VQWSTRLGLQIPYFNFPGVAPDTLFERLAGIAETAEASGFDSLWVMDHLHQIAGVAPAESWMLDGNTILAGLAARTSRVSLGLMVGGVTYRNPALVAKITTTLDVISSGRAVLGIGAAWNEAEHLAYGFRFPPIAERFELLEDALVITRSMFTQQRSTYAGKRASVDGAINEPRPVRGDIPIMLGGSGERKTLKLVAQHADASNIFGDAARVRHLLGVLEAHCEAVGRDPRTITKTRLGSIVIARTHAEAERKVEEMAARSGNPVNRALTHVGTPDVIAEQVAELMSAGLDGLLFNVFDVHDPDTVALVGETLRPVVSAPK
jgi:F420-dependent oxidoreductase-like protein